MSGRLAPALGVAAVAALVAAGTATRPGATPPAASHGGASPVTSVRLVCPGVDGTAAAPVQLTVADLSHPLDPTGSPTPHVTLTTLTGKSGTPTVPGAPDRSGSRSRRRASTTRVAAASDQAHR